MSLDKESRKAGKFPWGQIRSISLPVFLLSLFLPHFAFADGGAVIKQQISGPYRVTLFGSPSPLRAGPADLSVMIQDAKTGEPVLNQSVAIDVKAALDSTSTAWLPPCCSMAKSAGTVTATHANAQNKLLYAANIVLPASGLHDITVQIGDATAPSIESKIDVQPPSAPAASYWAYLAAPPLFIGIFALNQRLRRRS
jgi:hypothetical protein